MRSYLLALGLLFVMGSLAQDSLLPTGLFEEYLPRHSFRTTSFTGWSFGGDTVIMDDFIRLTPTEKGRKGWLWNSFPNSYSDWLVLTELRVSPNPDSPARLGADGMAVWFTKERSQPGPIFGNKDQFTGLGVILDTFDNDNKRDNPRIQIVYNDGSRSYDKNQDGRNIELASCQVNFRGQVPIKLKVAYFNKRLQVSYDTSGQVFEEHRKWTVCNTEPLYLEVPRLGYFGVTAETGDLFDNHDVYSFVTYRLAMQDPNINTRAHVYGEDQDRETQQAAERQRELDRIKDEQRMQQDRAQQELAAQQEKQRQEEQDRARAAQEQQNQQQQQQQQYNQQNNQQQQQHNQQQQYNPQTNQQQQQNPGSNAALENKLDALINAMGSGNRANSYGGGNDFSNLATKADVLGLATKSDVAACKLSVTRVTGTSLLTLFDCRPREQQRRLFCSVEERRSQCPKQGRIQPPRYHS
jgi:mannose-binding lectin 1